MRNRIKEYHRPENWDELRRLVYDRKDNRVIETSKLLIYGPDSFSKCDAVMDTVHLLRSEITEKEHAISIGGGTTLQEVAESLLLRRLADGILCHAASNISSLGYRNLAALASIEFDLIGTWNSNMVLPTGARPFRWGITAEFWLALDALSGSPMARSDSRLMQEVILPIHLQRRGAYSRVARAPHDVAIVAAYVTIEVVGGNCGEMRLAVSSLDPRTAREIEASVKGKKLSDDVLHNIGESVMKAVQPVDDFRASAEYRREMAGVLAKRALEMAWKRTTG